MKKGFTLIELLVVVLIIGILASKALPHYEKVVWQSRNTQLKSAARVVADAHKMHFLKTGRIATSFEGIPVSLPLKVKTTAAGTGSNVCNLRTPKGKAVLEGDNFMVVLNAVGIGSGQGWAGVAVWTKGKYKCNGFAWELYGPSSAQMWCVEARNGTSTIKKGEFCEDLETSTWAYLSGAWDGFKMP